MVDDNPADIQFAEIALHRISKDFTILTASTAEEGWDAYQKARDEHQPFDLVCTDFGMPQENGLWLAQQINKEVPVILISGGWPEEYAVRVDIAVREGMFAGLVYKWEDDLSVALEVVLRKLGLIFSQPQNYPVQPEQKGLNGGLVLGAGILSSLFAGNTTLNITVSVEIAVVLGLIGIAGLLILRFFWSRQANAPNPLKQIALLGLVAVISSLILSSLSPSGLIPVVILSLQVISQRKTYPTYYDLAPAQLYFGRYEKLYPLAVEYLRLYGGKAEFSDLADVLASATVEIGETESEYADIIPSGKRIIINQEFLDFLLVKGRGYKKVAMAFFAALALELRDGEGADTLELELKLAKKSLFSGSRLDDVKRLYQLKKTIDANDGKENDQRVFLNQADRLLIAADLMHRGRLLAAKRFARYLQYTRGYYGEITVAQAQEDLDAFMAMHPDIVKVRSSQTNELDKEGNFIFEKRYNFTPEFQRDDYFRGRLIAWDIEVSTQDEVDFGGKVANTGEMCLAPHIVTLRKFFSHSSASQYVFKYNTRQILEAKMREVIAGIERLRAEAKVGELNIKPSEIPEVLFRKLRFLRIKLGKDDEGTVAAQLEDVLANLRKSLEKIAEYQADSLYEFLLKLSAELQKKINLVNERLEKGEITKKGLSREYETVVNPYAKLMLVTARCAIVPDDFAQEIKTNFRELARISGMSVNELAVAVRSSAVGEDGEEASFAGRQDTEIFVGAHPTENDPEGLDVVVNEWVFVMASLFNKRATIYRVEMGMSIFDENVMISILFQKMFLSEFSFIGMTVDKNTGAPQVSISASEGQGEIIVSGTESGSKFNVRFDQTCGVMLVKLRGDRKAALVETEDGKGVRIIYLTDEQRQEFALTDRQLVLESSRYIQSLGDYWLIFADLEGGWRVKRDAQGNPIYLKDQDGNILYDERGRPRCDYMIASTQVRPETVESQKDPDIIILRKEVVTEEAYDKAVREGKVLPFKFLAKTGGAARGEIAKVADKKPESLAKTEGKIMFCYQSDPDMNEAMKASNGIIAIRGGPNSHTMIVATEYGMIAVTGTEEALWDMLFDGDEITIDAERGVLLWGIDHEIKPMGRDFNVRDLPDLRRVGARLGSITATRATAERQLALCRYASYYGVGLVRLELILADISVYPEALLAYDNYLRKKQGLSFEGAVLDEEKDAELIAQIRAKIQGYNSGEDYYKSILEEGLQAIADTINVEFEEVRILYQKIEERALRVKVKDIILRYYQAGLGHASYLEELKALTAQNSGDKDLLEIIIQLLDKRMYIRLDDRKSDEYGAIIGAERFVKHERNAMMGWRGLELLLDNPITTRWQMEAIYNVAKRRRNKLAVFAPICRRPQDVKQMLKMMDEVGLTRDLVKRGIMTEIPENVFRIEEFLATGIDFISTGGNDLLQMVFGIDRNAAKAVLKSEGTAYSAAILRANAIIARAVRSTVTQRRAQGLPEQQAGFCGNDPSVKDQENYGPILTRLFGYHSVSVTQPAFEAVAGNLANEGLVFPDAAYEAAKFSFKIDPAAQPRQLYYSQLNISDVRLHRLGGLHYRLFYDYDRGNLIVQASQESLEQERQSLEIKIEIFNVRLEREAGKATTSKDTLKQLAKQKSELDKRLKELERDLETIRCRHQVRALLRDRGYSPDEPGVGKRFYIETLMASADRAARLAQEKGQLFVLGSADISSDYLMRLTGGNRYEVQQANPDLGYRGLVRELDEDIEIFKWDLEVIARLRQKGYNNVALTLRFVRNSDSLDKVVVFLKEAGLWPLALGLDIVWPANVLEVDMILKKGILSFLSLPDKRQLTSINMAAELGNPNKELVSAQDVQDSTAKPISIVATACRDYNVGFHLEGWGEKIIVSAVEEKTAEQDLEAAERKYLRPLLEARTAVIPQTAYARETARYSGREHIIRMWAFLLPFIKAKGANPKIMLADVVLHDIGKFSAEEELRAKLIKADRRATFSGKPIVQPNPACNLARGACCPSP